MIRCLFDLNLFHSLHFPTGREIICSDGLDSLTWQLFAAGESIHCFFLFLYNSL